MLKWFTRNEPDGGASWVAEVDYGSGWFAYGPLLPSRHAADVFVRDLQHRGRAARVRQVETPQPAPAGAGNTRTKQGGSKGQARRRHGRPR